MACGTLCRSTATITLRTMNKPVRESRRSIGTPEENVLSRLREDLPDDVPLKICQSVIATGKSVCQLFVVESEQVQHRRVQVMNRDGILDGTKAEVVGRSVDGAAFDPAAAIHSEKPQWLWSRHCSAPEPLWLISTDGVRPNSPVQRISVSSSRPRCFKSVIKAASP